MHSGDMFDGLQRTRVMYLKMIIVGDGWEKSAANPVQSYCRIYERMLAVAQLDAMEQRVYANAIRQDCDPVVYFGTPRKKNPNICIPKIS